MESGFSYNSSNASTNLNWYPSRFTLFFRNELCLLQYHYHLERIQLKVKKFGVVWGASGVTIVLFLILIFLQLRRDTRQEGLMSHFISYYSYNILQDTSFIMILIMLFFFVFYIIFYFLWIGAQLPQEQFISYGRFLLFLLMLYYDERNIIPSVGSK